MPQLAAGFATPSPVHDGFATVRAARSCRPQSRHLLLAAAPAPEPPPRSTSVLGSNGSLPPPSPAPAPAPWLNGGGSGGGGGGNYNTWGHHSTASSWSSGSGNSTWSSSSGSSSGSWSSTLRPTSGRPLDPLWEEAVATKPVLRTKPQVPWWEIATRRSRYRSCPTLQVH